MTLTQQCSLCEEPGGEVLVQLVDLRVVMVDDPLYPGFCRVIHNQHIVEMTDLPVAERSRMMMSVCKVEQALREVMAPDKINLASFGNAVPHLHWHVVPRWRNDAHFPQPTWGVKQREADVADLEARRARLPALRQAIVKAFAMET